MARRSIKRVLLPPGSRRSRALWMAWLAARKMREGPGPWFRAVRLGLFQLLPPGAQKKLLRWTGRGLTTGGAPLVHGVAEAVGEREGLVSVVLPVFEQADMVGAAIDSVLAQTYDKLELIVVDDGSTDGVEAVLAPYLQDPRVRVLTQPNQGLPKALSTGFELAEGEFYTWTSADNLMDRRQLECLVARLHAAPELAMVYADYEIIDADGEPVRGTDFRVADRSGPDSPVIRLSRHTHNLNVVQDNFIGACFLYRAQVGRLIGDYNPELGLEDYDYWMRINRLFQVEHLGSDEVLYRYRVHDRSLSSMARELKIQERGVALMSYEKERADWVSAPWRYVADAASREWLATLVAAPDTLEESRGADLADGRKTLLLVAGTGLETLALDGLPENVAVAAWFDRPEEVYRQHLAVSSDRVAVFGTTPEVAARLAVFSRSVFLAEPGGDLLELARRFAANRTFFRMTREPDRLRRCVPEPLGTTPLRVLLQAQTFTQGGLERVVLDLAGCLKARGVEVSLLVLGEQGVDADAMRGLGIPVLELSRAEPGAYRELLREHRIGVVNAHDSVFGADVAAEVSVPFVQTIHNTYVWLDPERIEAYRAADRHTAAYVCVSAQTLCYSDLRLCLDVGKALVVPNGVELSGSFAEERLGGEHPLRAELGIEPGDFVFLNVASLYPPKAQRIAVQALARVLRDAPRARVVFLGRDMDASYARLVREEAADLGVAPAARFAGYHGDVRPFYAMADAFLLPSYWEGCSLAVFEALAAGLPLVLTDVGAAREQLALGRGELVPTPFSGITELDWTNLGRWVNEVQDELVDAVAAAMLRLCETAAPRAAPREPAWAMDRRHMARSYERLFRWLVQGGRPAAARAWLRRSARDDEAVD